MSAKYQTKKTSELAVGDVVNCHGMRCLIVKELEVSTSHDDAHNGTRYTRSIVLNRDDVSFESVPESFTSREGDGVPRWTIQGNDLATWSVELNPTADYVVAYSSTAALRGDFQIVELPTTGDRKRNAIIRERMSWKSVRGSYVTPLPYFRRLVDATLARAEQDLAGSIETERRYGGLTYHELAVKVTKETAAKLAMLSEKPAPIETPAYQTIEQETGPKTRELAAELAIAEEYDHTRSRLGHDYGSGQRRSELSRRRRELDSRLSLVPADSELRKPPTAAELVAAFEKIGVAKMRRAESETYRSETPATKRTLRAWRMVGMLVEQRRQADEPIVGRPCSGGAPEPGETPPPLAAPAKRTRDERDAFLAELAAAGVVEGARVEIAGSYEGGSVQELYRGVVFAVRPSGTVIVDDERETDGAGTPVRHYVSRAKKIVVVDPAAELVAFVPPPESTDEVIERLSQTDAYQGIVSDLEWLDRNVRLDPESFAADHLERVGEELGALVVAVHEGTI